MISEKWLRRARSGNWLRRARGPLLLPLLPLLLLLSACAGMPQSPAASSASPAKGHGTTHEEQLTSDLVYKFLLAEVANQRGQHELAARLYLELAQATRDPRVARRAAQIAYQSHQDEKAEQALELWNQLDPASVQAKQLLVSLYLGEGKLDQARPILKQYLAENPAHAGPLFLQLAMLLGHDSDKQGALALMRALAKPYPKLPEAHLALAHTAIQAGKQDEAVAEARRALELRPDWSDAVLFEVHLLAAHPRQALKVLKDFLAANPKDDEVRLVYARHLLDARHYHGARDAFRKLQESHPKDPNIAFAIGVLSLHLGDLEDAQKQFQRSITYGNKDQDTMQFYLGQLSEAKQDLKAAVAHYRQVSGGDHLYEARVREAYLLGKLGRLDEARDLLHHVRAQDAQQSLQLILLESELCRDAKQYDAAYNVLEKGLKQFPDQPDLLYEAGIMADKLGRPDEMESLLRKVMHLQPDNANAYNALGFSLIDRDVRVKEGMALVLKAHHLAPDDAAITDSLGWGYYRQGKLELSLKYLRRAYSADPDPEIGAHLGEVLWAHGNKAEARKVWNGARKAHPDNEALNKVMRKYLK